MITQARTSRASVGCEHVVAPANSGTKRLDLPKSKGVNMPDTERETLVCYRDNFPFRSPRRLITGQGITTPILPDYRY